MGVIALNATSFQTGGGSGTIGGSIALGQVAYGSAADTITGDSLFTRNPTTKETFIGLTGTDLASNLQITPTGNSLIWDADTTDDILDAFIQASDVFGSGSPGSVLARYNSGTSERAIIGTTEFSGVLSVFGTATNPDDTITSNLTMSANAGGGFAFTYEDTNINQRSRFRMNTDDGNLWQFTPDILGNIDCRIEQNNDILGFGAFSGTAMIWSDSGTQVNGLVGAVDGTPQGLFPGSSIISTFNSATGASGSISTNYDNVNNIATIVANTSNGNFDSGFEFTDSNTLIRYRNGTTGLESKMIAQDGNVYLSYKALTASDEYQAVLADGIFTFSNRDTTDNYLSLDAVAGIYGIGDLDNSISDTNIQINANTQSINFNSSGVGTNAQDIPITVKYTLTTAELLSIGTTPPEVVPAPGAGKMIQVISVSSKYNFNTTNYVMGGSKLVTRYTNDAALSGSSAQFWGGTNLIAAFGQLNPYGLWTPLGGTDGIIFSTTFENQGISIQTDDLGDPTAGDGTLDVYVTYKVTTL